MTDESERIQQLEQRIEQLEQEATRGSSAGSSPTSSTRRQMLGALSVGGLLLGGAGTAAAAPYDDDLGSARFVGEGESLQDAVNKSNLVFVTSAYDSSVEEVDTIEIDREITVMGDGNTYIDNPGGSGPAVEIVSKSERPNAVSLQNLSIRGGDPGLLIEDTKFCELSNVHVRETSGHGIAVRNPSLSTNSMDLYHTSVQDSSDDGIYIEGGAHSTNLFGVRTLFAGGHGVNINGSHAVNMMGCQVEDSQGYGLRMEGLSAANVYGAYVEGNKQDTGLGSESAEIYAESCYGLSIDSAYGNPLNNSLRSFIYLKGCRTATVHGTRIKGGYSYLVDGPTQSGDQNRRLDVYRGTHYPGYSDGVVSDPDIAKRLRSNGVVVAKNIGDANGQHPGEIGVHNAYTNDTPEFYVWDDSGENWVSYDGTTTR
ncbi:Right handed beta helix region [Halomicrobium zhouii]|uniref:Right handed beta helix region n=1 Tax=Halomicrobium zhouii TaxID=767519 RepID=A0A1I6LDY5_9EURY|nr:right-handed parallel beta-helix repeat-containing protein [Halomicrobium zhouii]SFS01659.1 Right handed beta helix region [Halomicrobium zhouii]